MFSVLINTHRERHLLSLTLESVSASIDYFATRVPSAKFEIILVCDKGDAVTKEICEEFCERIPGAQLHNVDFGNLGSSREFGVSKAKSNFIFFLDGDDLVSANWFHEGFNLIKKNPGSVVHTEYFIGFSGEVFFRRSIPNTDPYFDPHCLVSDWFYCNNCVIDKRIFFDVPIEPYDHSIGYGAEDWHWSCQTQAAGVRRLIADGTSYFYRVKPAAESLGSRNDLLPRKSRLFSAAYVREAEIHIADLDWSPRENCVYSAIGDVDSQIAEQALEAAQIDHQIFRVCDSIAAGAKTFGPRSSFAAAAAYRAAVHGLRDSYVTDVVFADDVSDYRLSSEDAFADRLRSSNRRQLLIFGKMSERQLDLIRSMSRYTAVVLVPMQDIQSIIDITHRENFLARFFIQFKVGDVFLFSEQFNHFIHRFKTLLNHHVRRVFAWQSGQLKLTSDFESLKTEINRSDFESDEYQLVGDPGSILSLVTPDHFDGPDVIVPRYLYYVLADYGHVVDLSVSQSFLLERFDDASFRPSVVWVKRAWAKTLFNTGEPLSVERIMSSIPELDRETSFENEVVALAVSEDGS